MHNLKTIEVPGNGPEDTPFDDNGKTVWHYGVIQEVPSEMAHIIGMF